LKKNKGFNWEFNSSVIIKFIFTLKLLSSLIYSLALTTLNVKVFSLYVPFDIPMTVTNAFMEIFQKYIDERYYVRWISQTIILPDIFMTSARLQTLLCHASLFHFIPDSSGKFHPNNFFCTSTFILGHMFLGYSFILIKFINRMSKKPYSLKKNSLC